MDPAHYNVETDGLATATEPPDQGPPVPIKASPLDLKFSSFPVVFGMSCAATPGADQFVASLGQLAEAVPMVAGRINIQAERGGKLPADQASASTMHFVANNQGIGYRVLQCSLSLTEFEAAFFGEMATVPTYRLGKPVPEPPYLPQLDTAGLLAGTEPLLHVWLTLFRGGGCFLAFNLSHALVDGTAAQMVAGILLTLMNGQLPCAPHELATQVHCGRQWLTDLANEADTVALHSSPSLPRRLQQFLHVMRRYPPPVLTRLQSTLWWVRLLHTNLTRRVLRVPLEDLELLQATAGRALPGAHITLNSCMTAAFWVLLAYLRGQQGLPPLNLAISFHPPTSGGKMMLASAAVGQRIMMPPCDSTVNTAALLSKLRAQNDPVLRAQCAADAVLVAAAEVSATVAEVKSGAAQWMRAALDSQSALSLTNLETMAAIYVHDVCRGTISHIGDKSVGSMTSKFNIHGKPARCTWFGLRNSPPWIAYAMRTAMCVEVHLAMPVHIWQRRAASHDGKLLVAAMLPGAEWL